MGGIFLHKGPIDDVNDGPHNGHAYQRQRPPAALLFLLFLPLPALFYFFTTAPGLAHADQAIIIDEMQDATLHGGATSHNLTVLAGYAVLHWLHFGEAVYRANLVSAAFGACAVALFFVLAERLTGSALPSAFAAIFLMISHSMWWHATVAEAYAVNAFLCVSILYCLLSFDLEARPRWLDLAAALSGLAIFNHAQMGMWLPALGAVALFGRHGRPKAAVALRAGLFYVMGLLPYLLVIARDAIAAGSLAHSVGEAAGAEFKSLFFTVNAQAFEDTARIFMMQWGWPSLYLVHIVVGIAWLARRREWRATSLATAIAFTVNTVFFAFYPTWDKYAFLLSSFVILSFAGTAGIGLAWAALTRYGRSGVALFALAHAAACAYPVLFFSRLHDAARNSRFWGVYAVNPETRYTMFDGRYLANPDKGGYRAVEDYIRLACDRLPPGAVVVDHIARTFFQFRYAQRFRAQRADIDFLAFVPSASDPARWPNGIGTDRAVALIEHLVPARDVFVTSLVLGGFRDVVTRLLDRGVTFVEIPFGPDAGIFQARRTQDLAMTGWVDDVRIVLDPPIRHAPACCRFPHERAASLGVRLSLRRRNPPCHARVDWVDRNGTRRAGTRLKLPFDASPALFAPEAALSRGAWTAEVFLFDQRVATIPFELE